MLELAVSILVGLSSFFAATDMSASAQWTVQKQWVHENNSWVYSATSDSISKLCNDDLSIVFPQVIHGVHSIWLDDRLVIETGDASFKVASAFYERPSLDCKYLKNIQSIKWTVVSYSQFFAKNKSFPNLKSGTQAAINSFFDVYLNIAIVVNIAILLCLAIFLFAGKIHQKYLVVLILGGLAFIGYSILVVNNRFQIQLSMLHAHKTADVCLWIGATAYFYFFKDRKYISNRLFQVYLGFLIIAFLFLCFGTSPDVVQFGTMFPMPIAILIFTRFLFKIGRKIQTSKMNYLEFFSGLFFVFTAFNDLLNIFGIIDGYMLVPLAAVFVFFHMAAIVNENIKAIYEEKELLMKELERKHILEQIAHDIKSPLSVLTMLVPTLAKDPSGEKSELIMQASARITGIANSLLDKNSMYSGTHEFLISSVLNRLIEEKKIEFSKSRAIHFHFVDMTNGKLSLEMDEVEFVRMLSNIINNSIEAVESVSSPSIEIKIEYVSNGLSIKITDNGIGISADIINQLGRRGYTFGKADKLKAGSGLGLFHAKSFVQNNVGELSIDSEPGKGTTILIRFGRKK